MTNPNTKTVTRLLGAAGHGDDTAKEQLRSLVYGQLCDLARREPHKEAHVQTAALVENVYNSLLGQAELRWVNRYHFYKAAALAMRQLMLDAARRQGMTPESTQLGARLSEEIGIDALALNEALDRLEKVDPRACEVVHLRFLAGLSVEDTALALQLMTEEIKDIWTWARAWLHRELKSEVSPSAPD